MLGWVCSQHWQCADRAAVHRTLKMDYTVMSDQFKRRAFNIIGFYLNKTNVWKFLESRESKL